MTMLSSVHVVRSARARVASQPASSVQITSFTLETTAANGTYPFTAGVGFKKGDVPSSFTCDLANYQVNVLRTWSDGSVKHAIVSGRAALTQNVPLTVTVSTGTPPAGTALTASDIQAAAPSASIQCGAIGTVNLSSLLASPFRTWVSGPEMVECHYRADVGGGTQLSAWFHVRLFADGRVWVRCIVENGYLDNGSGSTVSITTQSYVPTLSVGGSTVYNNGGASLSHYAHTRYSAEGWIGGSPAITPLLNVAYLRDSKLVPNYSFSGASSSTLNALTQSYTPMNRGAFTANMGDTGYQPQIGLLPNWEALFCSTGDARAYNAVLAGASSLNSYAIVRRGKTSQRPIKPSDFTNWNIGGPAAGGQETLSTSAGNSWEYNHHPSGGFLAYLLTGDYWHYETMLLNASLCYLCPDSSNGSGTSRLLRRQTRGTAWAYRTIGQLCGIAPDEDIGTGNLVEDYRSLLANNYTNWNNVINAAGSMVWTGSVYQFEVKNFDWGTVGAIAPWMTDFWLQTNGHVSDLEPLASMTTFNTVRDWMYRWIVGRLGVSGDVSTFDFTQAARYGMEVATDTSGSTWWQTWGEIFEKSTGGLNNSASNTLTGGNITDGTGGVTSYWGNLHPAIAYAVEHGAAGAAAAYARLTGATNYSTVSGNFPDFPVFGVTPRA